MSEGSALERVQFQQFEWKYLEHFEEYPESSTPHEVLPTGPPESAEQFSYPCLEKLLLPGLTVCPRGTKLIFCSPPVIVTQSITIIRFQHTQGEKLSVASNLGREGLYNGRPLGIFSIIRAKIRGMFVGTDLEDFEPKGKNI